MERNNPGEVRMIIKALVTGITGMVGSHLVDYLLANTDWHIYGMCRWRSPLDNIQHIFQYIPRLKILLEPDSAELLQAVVAKAEKFVERYDYRVCLKPYVDFLNSWSNNKGR
jgi:nucleoside-diphosphate-sugar epimerase